MQSSGEWSLPEKHILAWLMMVEGIGQSRLRLIVLAHKKGEIRLSEIWRQPAILVKLLKLKKIEESIHILQNEYTPAKVGEWLVRHHIHIITEDELVYPPLLKQIHRPPIMLFCQGALDKSWWDIPVAVVGSRHMTEYGRMVTNTLVAQLVELGASIVSGGMYGVDLTAHQAAVKNQGKTLILLGYGFGHSYPAWIQPKHQTILEGGGVIMSQFAPLSTPTKGSFVARNRLVAGLSQTVLVVEAAVRSGTHLTVEFALDEGRDVCAVPGPIGNPYSQGTKWLINQGARLVTSGVEIISVRLQSPDSMPERLRKLMGKMDAFWLMPDPVLITKSSLMVLADFSCANSIPFYAPTYALVQGGATASFAPKIPPSANCLTSSGFSEAFLPSTTTSINRS